MTEMADEISPGERRRREELPWKISQEADHSEAEERISIGFSSRSRGLKVPSARAESIFFGAATIPLSIIRYQPRLSELDVDDKVLYDLRPWAACPWANVSFYAKERAGNIDCLRKYRPVIDAWHFKWIKNNFVFPPFTPIAYRESLWTCFSLFETICFKHTLLVPRLIVRISLVFLNFSLRNLRYFLLSGSPTVSQTPNIFYPLKYARAKWKAVH